MRINAYILAADPAWIETGVRSYYDIVDTIIVSYDQSGKGWTGLPIDTEECIERVRAIDSANKVRLVAGDFARLGHTPIDNDTHQRQCALDHASAGTEWVLQLDTDEILPNSRQFAERLHKEIPADFAAVDWPMRTFFNRTERGDFLEVCGITGRQVSSYPGPIAVRSGTRLKHARQADVPTYRYDVRRRDTDPAAGNRPVHRVISDEEAILHLSWIRSEEEIRNKLQSWGHSHDFDWREYLDRVWRRAPRAWRWMFRLHPMCPRWWPALRRVRRECVPLVAV